MDKFIGKINGVEYATREEFCKVLGELKPEDIKSISLIEQSTNEAPEKNDTPKHEKKELSGYDANETIETLFDLFGSFVKSLKNHNKPVQKTCGCDKTDLCGCDPDQKACACNKNDCKKKTEQTEQQFFNEIVEHFAFNETTYEFTGGELDELELDKFDGLLARRAKEFAELDWDSFDLDSFDRDMLTELREEFAERYSKACRSNEKTVEEQHKLDDRLAKVERLIDAYKDLEMDTDKAEEEYKKLQCEFDILDNKGNYYDLLKHYYAEIIGVIDAQY